ncbi:hypothetical protein [Caloramator sp. mosi_1]
MAYTLKDNANGDKWKNIVVAFNGTNKEQKLLFQAVEDTTLL